MCYPQFSAYARGRESVHGYKLGDYLHVVRSQFHDIGVAKKLGYQFCWIQRRKGKESFGGSPAPAGVTTPDYHFSNLAELADAAEKAFARAMK